MAACFFIASLAPCRADPAIHYAPAENLEHVDVALIDRAEREEEAWRGRKKEEGRAEKEVLKRPRMSHP